MNIDKHRFQNKKLTLLFLPFAFCLFTCLSNAQTLAPGAPGGDAQWASAGKQGVGTSASLESKVWFTLQGGALTEVYYPDVTIANVHLLQIVVVNPKTKKVETERDDATHTVTPTSYSYKEDRFSLTIPRKEIPDSLNFIQVNKAKSGDWTIYKTYTVDAERNAILLNVSFHSRVRGLELYIYYDPSLNNSGMHDTAWNDGQTLLAQDSDKASALISESNLSEISNGYYQVSDGLEQLRSSGKIVNPYAKAENGNVVQIARLSTPKDSAVKVPLVSESYIFALGFGKSANEAKQSATLSLTKGWAKVEREYEKGWSDYVKTLRQIEPKYQAQFNMAAMILKAHEDKTNRGANIASLSVPWGGGDNANKNNVGGYHLVWSRDLYQVATAFMALGDKAAAERALDFLFKVQQKPDGSFPQNSWLDGKPFWGSLQLDEVAYPLILAYQLGKNDKATYENHVKKAADFIVKTGPKTPQERWEEEGGFSPSTIAAEIAGLVCAAEIAKKNGDEASATVYLATADDWARNIERWTATTNGKYGDGNYYLRITNNGNPDAGERIELNNGAGFFDEREIVDAGFLELVRLGIKSPDDPLIAKSVKVIDQVIKVNTPNGEGFYRYNYDGYGEMDDGRRWNWDGKYTGKGRLWALLSGERGQFHLAEYNYYQTEKQFRSRTTRGEYLYSAKEQAKKHLDSMLNFANEGLMIPEQVWDSPKVPKADSQFSPNLKFGEGTGSATPLAWSMAQFIRLAVNLQEGRNTDTPDIVYNRYVKNGVGGQTGFNLSSPTPDDLAKLKAGETFTVKGTAQPNSTVAYLLGEQRASAKVGADGNYVLTAKMPETETPGFLAIITPDNSSFVSLTKIGGAQTPEKLSAEIVEKVKNAKTSPIIVGNKAIFIYRGAGNQVRLAGDFTGWQPRGAILQETSENLKAAAVEFPATARVEYKLIVDGNWISDPLNPNKLDNGVGSENSVFTMPEYKATIWDKGNDTFLDNTDFKSEVFNGVRLVQTYVPSECVKNVCAVLYFQDGTDYIKLAKAVQVQQNLVKANKVKPFIMVFVDPKERTKEYWASDDYAKFLATEVVPTIDAKYNTIKNRDGRAVLGASLGGITSVWVGLKYPEVFSRIGGQSSSFWVDNERVVKELSKLDADKTKFKFYFDDGGFEGVEDSRRVNVMLRGKGFPVTYVEGETGHNWTSWRDRLADAFIALWK